MGNARLPWDHIKGWQARALLRRGRPSASTCKQRHAWLSSWQPQPNRASSAPTTSSPKRCWWRVSHVRSGTSAVALRYRELVLSNSWDSHAGRDAGTQMPSSCAQVRQLGAPPLTAAVDGAVGSAGVTVGAAAVVAC